MHRIDRESVLNAFLEVVVVVTILWTSADLLQIDGLLHGEIASNLTIYAISRSLNAAISLVQSAEISLIVANVDIGELLDPVNDAIERFSTVLTWATTSLLIQKFVITLVGSTAYKAIGSVAALIYLLAVALRLRSGRVATMAKSALAFFGWITLASVASIWFSVSVTTEWVGDSLRSAERDLQAFKLEATQLQGLVTGTFDADTETSKALEEQRRTVLEGINAAERLLPEIDAEIAQNESQLEALQQKRSWMDRVRSPFGGGESPEVRAVDEALLAAQERKQTLEFEIDARRVDLACIDRQLSGGTCESVMGRLSAFTSGVKALAAKSPQLIVSLLDVMAAVIFKHLLAPLLLAYVILKFGPSWIAVRVDRLTPNSLKELVRSELARFSRDG